MSRLFTLGLSFALACALSLLAHLSARAEEAAVTGHKAVLITDEALVPRVATLKPGQVVAWFSYSPGESVVLFEREVAREMVCHRGASFSLEGDALRSVPLEAGELASFCVLRPGRYRYEVARDEESPLEGEIVVAGAE